MKLIDDRGCHIDQEYEIILENFVNNKNLIQAYDKLIKDLLNKTGMISLPSRVGCVFIAQDTRDSGKHLKNCVIEGMVN